LLISKIKAISILVTLVASLTFGFSFAKPALASTCYTFSNGTDGSIHIDFLYVGQVVGPPAVQALDFSAHGVFPNVCFNGAWAQADYFSGLFLTNSAGSRVNPLGSGFTYYILGEGSPNPAVLPAGSYTINRDKSAPPQGSPPHQNPVVAPGPAAPAVPVHPKNPDPVFFPDDWFTSGFLDAHQFSLHHLITNYYHVGDCDLMNAVIVVRDDGAAKFHSIERTGRRSDLNGDQWHFVVVATMTSGGERGGAFDGPKLLVNNQIYYDSGDFSGKYTFTPGDYSQIASVTLRWPQC
jgi:hypothetical protein